MEEQGINKFVGIVLQGVDGNHWEEQTNNLQGK